jgi:cytochrome c-type biogenesis protein
MPDGLLALAVGAGMLAAVNPCGFALLPAYLSLLILGEDQPTKTRAVLRALRLTAAMSLGFALVFAVFGLAIAPVAAGAQRYLPWFTIALGLGLALLGGVMLLGKTVTLPKFSRSTSTNGGRPITASFGSMVGFGASYATASLTCTIAPFLVVVVNGFRQESWAVGTALFLAYAAGMGLVVGTVAVAVALARDAVVRNIRRTGRWMPQVSGLLLLLAGAYVAYYGWWEIRVLAGGDPEDPVIGAAGKIQHTLVDWVQMLPAMGWLAIGAVLVFVAFARRHRGVATTGKGAPSR